jgi:hypothetical protein
MSKPSLYAVCASQQALDASRGDYINEMRSLRTLQSVFDVFYNNVRLGQSGEANGLGPNREYDFYYVRNNSEIFNSIKGPRISFAYHYEESVFSDSVGLVVPTENWKEHLLDKRADSDVKLRLVYGTRPTVLCPVVNVGQTLDPGMAKKDVNSKDLRCMGAGARLFGYYGNLNKDYYPYKAFAALERLWLEVGPAAGPTIVLAGYFAPGSYIQYQNSTHIGAQPYKRMPALYDNTFVALTNESALNHLLGNQKVIDSMSRGVPILCQRLDTFVDQLGADYPCFYETEDDAYRIAKQLLMDEDFYTALKAYCLQRAQRFTPAAVVQTFLAQREELDRMLA